MTGDLARPGAVDWWARPLALAADVRVEAALRTAQFAVRLFEPRTLTVRAGGVGELPAPGRVGGTHAEALGLAPCEWLLLTKAAVAGHLHDVLVGTVGAGGTVVRLDAARVVFDLRGAAVRAVLARGCAVDLHPSVLRPGMCVQAPLAQVHTIVWRPAEEEERYRIAVPRSFAEHVASWLQAAATRVS